MRFDKGQVKSFVKAVKAEAGSGWAMLGPRIQKALITEKALYILGSQVEETSFNSEVVHSLNNAMLTEAGLMEEL
jgi:hypothetical protein